MFFRFKYDAFDPICMKFLWYKRIEWGWHLLHEATWDIPHSTVSRSFTSCRQTPDCPAHTHAYCKKFIIQCTLQRNTSQRCIATLCARRSSRMHATVIGNLGKKIWKVEPNDSWSLSHLGHLYPGTTPVMIKLPNTSYVISWVHDGSIEVDDRPRLRRTSHGMGHDISPPRDCNSTVFPAIANFWQRQPRDRPLA